MAAVATLALAGTGGATADLTAETSVTERGLRIGDESRNLTLLPYLQLDAGHASEGEARSEDVRRARIYAIGTSGRFGAAYVPELATDEIATIAAYVDWSADGRTTLRLGQHTPPFSLVGLTSACNVAFVEASELYDRVMSYDDIGEIEGTDSVLVDFAGNASVLRRLHEHLGDALKYSCLVGATHVDERGSGTDGIPGPTPTLFFAPDHSVALFKSVGPEEAGKQIAASWHGFLEDAGDSIEIERKQGLEAARDTFVAMLGGDIDPAKGIVIEP